MHIYIHIHTAKENKQKICWFFFCLLVLSSPYGNSSIVGFWILSCVFLQLLLAHGESKRSHIGGEWVSSNSSTLIAGQSFLWLSVLWSCEWFYCFYQSWVMDSLGSWWHIVQITLYYIYTTRSHYSAAGETWLWKILNCMLSFVMNPK